MNMTDVSEENSGGEEQDIDHLLPPHPTEPLASDCCGLGCKPCVYDIYDQELALWQAECEKIKYGNNSATPSDNSLVILSPDGYRTFELLCISQVTSDVYKYTFIIPGGRTIPLKVGQHLVLRWKRPHKVVTRQYTPISPGNSKGKMDFIIKIYPDGEMSQYIKTWKPGDLVEWRGPFGSFSYTKNMYKHIVMLAAGTGIAPMIQLIHHVLDDENDNTWLHLIYACKTYNSILCKDLLDDWSDYWNFSVIYVLSDEKRNSSVSFRYHDQIVYGQLTENLVRRYIMDYKDSVRVLICGTKSFDKDMLNYLGNMNVPTDDIFRF